MGTLYEVFGLPEDTPPGTAMKDLKGIVEVSTARILLPADTSSNLALKDLVSQIDGFEVQIIRDAVAQLLSQ